jgi:hypothetical protein
MRLVASFTSDWDRRAGKRRTIVVDAKIKALELIDTGEVAEYLERRRHGQLARLRQPARPRRDVDSSYGKVPAGL